MNFVAVVAFAMAGQPEGDIEPVVKRASLATDVERKTKMATGNRSREGPAGFARSSGDWPCEM